MIDLLSLWSHALAACLYAGLAVWQLRGNGAEIRRPLTSVFAVLSLWALCVALLGPLHSVSLLAESGRNIACLGFLYTLLDRNDGDERQKPLKFVFGAVAAAIALRIILAGLMPRFEAQPALVEGLISTSQMIGLVVATGALILVHNVYGQASRESRTALRLPLLALAAMWAYDLHLFTAAYLMRAQPLELYALRGAVAALLVPCFVMALRRTVPQKVQFSRAATFQSLSLLGILAYLLLMMSANRALEVTGTHWIEAAQLGLLALMSLAACALLASPAARGWAQVMVQKHLFQHRYDYRQEWLRFTATMGATNAADGAALEQRIVKALADIAGSPGGMLLRRVEDRLVAAGIWNWPSAPAAPGARTPDLIAVVESAGHVIDFTAAADARVTLPDWLAGAQGAWAGIPLVHAGRLVGIVIITTPPVRRSLDWEDYDLFRTAGRQAASSLAEADSRDALAEASRFDEFNRRFAFILHDIKNLVSQLSLVARNAERHADNPEFRADMVATLQSSVRKMNDMLVRLAPGTLVTAEGAAPRAVTMQPFLTRIADAKGRSHPVRLDGNARTVALADPEALERAIGHIVQNAIEASDANTPVEIGFAQAGGQVSISIRDRGHGMSAEFIQTRLFQPFASTKEGGFGVGAHEARSLIERMGGRLEVESREGAGTRFTIRLPAVAETTTTSAEPTRIRA